MKNIVKIYDEHYKKFEKDKPLGIRYPTEALVVFVSNLRKNKKIILKIREKNILKIIILRERHWI